MSIEVVRLRGDLLRGLSTCGLERIDKGYSDDVVVEQIACD